MCTEEKFDQILQETLICDRLLRNTSKKEFGEDHVIKDFTRLMLCGNVRAVVTWLSEKSDGVLHPTDMVDVSDSNRKGSRIFVYMLCF